MMLEMYTQAKVDGSLPPRVLRQPITIPEARVTVGEAIRMIETALRDQAGVAVTQIDARLRVSYLPSSGN